MGVLLGPADRVEIVEGFFLAHSILAPLVCLILHFCVFPEFSDISSLSECPSTTSGCFVQISNLRFMDKLLTMILQPILGGGNKILRELLC